MSKIRRLFVVTILLGAAITGLALGAQWTGSESDSGAAIEPDKPAAQYNSVQAGAKEQMETDAPNSYNWALYTGVSALTGLYITARIIGARKRGKNKNLR
ncbi:MAG: hypothetical protein ABRQ26_12480 [Syntrophomonadaceae bacterium]